MYEVGLVLVTECFQGTFHDRMNFASFNINKKGGKVFLFGLFFYLYPNMIYTTQWLGS